VLRTSFEYSLSNVTVGLILIVSPLWYLRIQFEYGDFPIWCWLHEGGIERVFSCLSFELSLLGDRFVVLICNVLPAPDGGDQAAASQEFCSFDEDPQADGIFRLPSPLNGGVEQGFGCFYVRVMISHMSVSF